MTETVLVTGAAGGLGRLMRPRLARPDRTLRLLDLVPCSPPDNDEAVEVLTGSVTDPETMREACDGVDSVIHLGGISLEAEWPDILRTNIHGAQVVLQTAQEAGTRRVVLASSNHAVGFYDLSAAGEDGLPATVQPRPDSYYGVSKVAMEGLGSLFHDRFGLDVTSVRIGSCFERPWDPRSLWTWMSPDDGARLLEACLATQTPAYRTVWGISANTRRWWSLAEGRSMGYDPQDDSEVYAPDIMAAQDWDLDAPEQRLAGGSFATRPLGVPH